ncbi:MAG TPA: hypothetical protein VGK31_11880 [Thermoanaerobaculia bacterium]
MKRMIPLVVFATAVYAAEIPVQRVAGDAKVVDRVAEAAKRDLPHDLLKRILNEDIETLRGKRADGTYEFATFERLEASRDSKSYSVQPRKNDALDSFEVKGTFVYRLIIELPSRRMLVTKNRRVFVDHVDLEYVPIASSAAQRQTVKVEAWLEPGEVKPIDFPEVARQGVARVSAKADPAAGYGNFVLTLVQAKVIDNADSPYADAVASAKAIIRAVDNNDIKSIRAMAARLYGDLDKTPSVATPAAQTVDVVAAKPAPDAEIYSELQSIEDLLTGSDSEKRQGLDKLHQLVRRLRPH